ERREDVIAMVAERDLGRPDFGRDPIQDAAAEPRAERAHRRTFGHHALHHAVGVLFDDPESDAALLEIARQQLCGEPRLLLIEIDGDDLEGKRRAILEREQNVQQRVTVFTPRQAYHHAVAVLDQAEVPDRLTHDAG